MNPRRSTHLSVSFRANELLQDRTRRHAADARPRYTPPQLWHLLSLDAPTVASLWTLFLARCAGISLPWSCGPAMFVAVWMLYAADRLLDARACRDAGRPVGPELRHRFHWRHRAAFMTVLGAGALLLPCLLPQLGARTLRCYVVLGLVLMLWLAAVHGPRRARNGSQPLPKELAVGLFFGFAVAVPSLTRAPQRLGPLLPAAGLLAAVCALNCVLLYAWEHDGPDEQGDRGPAHLSTAWAVRHARSLGWGIIVAGLTLCLAILLRNPMAGTPAAQFAEFPLACALSGFLLLSLDTRRGQFDRLTLRAAADATLLAPMVFLAVHR